MIRKKRRWRFSPITSRILAVNVGALLILALGLLYTGQYERELIASEKNALVAEGKLLAAALAGGGVRETIDAMPVLAEDLSRHMLRKLVENSEQRTILFNTAGQLVLDSHHLLGPGGIVEIVELEPPFQSLGFKEKIRYILHKALGFLPTRLRLDHFPRENIRGAQDYPGLIDTLAGEIHTSVWRDADGHILLTASLPIQNLKSVMGAILLMRPADNIDTAVRDVQLTVIKLFLWALLATMLLSIYLSETIAMPIMRLSEAAENVGRSLSLKDSVPDLSWRRDEIGDLSKAFREMTQALSERVDAISNFAADVAHEIRNPLASVGSALETFMRVKDPAQQEKLCRIMQDDLRRINRLVTDISAASQVDSDLAREEKTRLDMEKLAAGVAEFEMARVGKAGKIQIVTGGNKNFSVTGTETQMSRVLRNLLDNALSFSTPEGRVVISLQRVGDKVVVHVDNDGPHIPEGKLEKIFQRFYSERPEGEKFGLHSGLGLNLSRQIVRAHQGTIFASNLKPKGVRFTIILPAGV